MFDNSAGFLAAIMKVPSVRQSISRLPVIGIEGIACIKLHQSAGFWPLFQFNHRAFVHPESLWWQFDGYRTALVI
ncbi:MAG: hypothetical protein V7703_05235 [Hyphomicrobiales bacterium]